MANFGSNSRPMVIPLASGRPPFPTSLLTLEWSVVELPDPRRQHRDRCRRSAADPSFRRVRCPGAERGLCRVDSGNGTFNRVSPGRCLSRLQWSSEPVACTRPCHTAT